MFRFLYYFVYYNVTRCQSRMLLCLLCQRWIAQVAFHADGNDVVYQFTFFIRNAQYDGRFSKAVSDAYFTAHGCLYHLLCRYCVPKFKL